MLNIFQTTKNDEVMVMLAVKNKNEKSTIVRLAVNNPQVQEIDHKELQNLGLPGICKLGPNMYFIYGGKSYTTNKLVNSCYVYNSKKNTLIRTNNMIKPLNDQFSIRRKNDMLAICGRDEQGRITQDFWSFNLKMLQWKKLPDVMLPIKGIKKVFLDYQDNLVIIAFPNIFLKFNFDQNKWEKIKEFYYEYSRLYVGKNNDCYIFNTYHNTLYKYDFYNDEICTLKLLDDFKISDTFYLEELDLIFFMDNDSNQQFLTFNCQNEELKAFGQEDYDKIFGQFQCFRAYDNPKLLRKDQVNVTQVGDFMKNKLLIFGNFHTPFQMVIDYDQETVKLHSVPTDLCLKNEQGMLSFAESKVLLTAGYKDDVSYHQTVETQVYDVQTKKIQHMDNLTFSIGDNYLSRLDLVDKQYIVCIAIDEIQVLDNVGQKWVELPHLDSQGMLPCKLDLIDQFTVFFTYTDKENKNMMEFWEFNFVDNKWNIIYKQQVDFKITLKFCKRLKDDEYLVIQTVDKSEYFCVMKLDQNQDGQIKDLQFTKLEKMCDKNIKSYILDYGLFQSRYMYFIYVKDDFTIDFCSFDLKNRKIYTDNKIDNLNQQIINVFKKMRYERYLWTFNTFGMVSRYVQLN